MRQALRKQRRRGLFHRHDPIRQNLSRRDAKDVLRLGGERGVSARLKRQTFSRDEMTARRSNIATLAPCA
jgi:hypothetical protein